MSTPAIEDNVYLYIKIVKNLIYSAPVMRQLSHRCVMTVNTKHVVSQ